MPRKDARTFIKPHLLFVEGLDEMGLLIRLLEIEEIESVQIVDLEGYTNLASRLSAAKKTEGWVNVTRVGILLDSDDLPNGRVDLIKAAINGAGLVAPTTALSFSEGSPAVAYSTVPAPGEIGCLETLIQRSVTNNAERLCVDSYLECAGQLTNATTALNAKRWVHTYFSRTDCPGLKIGEAANSGLIDLTSPAFVQLRDFLRALATAEAHA